MELLPGLEQASEELAKMGAPPEGLSVAETRAWLHQRIDETFTAMNEERPPVASEVDHRRCRVGARRRDGADAVTSGRAAIAGIGELAPRRDTGGGAAFDPLDFDAFLAAQADRRPGNGEPLRSLDDAHRARLERLLPRESRRVRRDRCDRSGGASPVLAAPGL